MNKICKYLKDQKVLFETFEHIPAGDPIEYSKLNGTKLSEQAKAIFLQYICIDKHYEYIIYTLPANKRIDFKLLLKYLDRGKSIKIANENIMYEVTKCNFGELPPIASFWNLKLYMDKELLDQEKIYFNAASLSVSIIMNPLALMKLENATII